MTPDSSAADASLPDAIKLQVAAGAMAQIRALSESNSALQSEIQPSPARRRDRIRRRFRGHRRVPHVKARATKKSFESAWLKTLLEAGQNTEAAAYAAALLPVRKADGSFLAAARLAFARVGAVSLQLETVLAQRGRSDSDKLRQQEALYRGRLRETDPTWLPQASQSSSFEPLPDRVLHLLKASMPHRQSGYTMRSQYILAGQRAIGLDPVALTALAFPRQIGLEPKGLAEEVQGTMHYRLDSLDDALWKGPPDAYLDAYAAAAAERIVSIRPSVLHVHSGHRGFEAGLVGLALARAFDLPMVYEVRGFFESTWGARTDLSEVGETYARRLAAETRCMREADAVVTLSESMRNEIVARGISPAKVFVVPNGVDVDKFYPQPRVDDLVRKLGTREKFVYGYVSNLDHYREGHESLIRAAVALRRRGVQAVALIIGDGKRRDELERIVAEEGAEDVVIFTGRVPHGDVLAYYRLLDVFVVPRVPERAARLVTPLKPFEAMAAGLPVVVSDLEALREIVGDGERGRVFHTEDADSLADTLQGLYENPQLRVDLAERGRAWVIAERQWATLADRYNKIYASLGWTRAR